jgi:hypothetical protein
MMAREIHTRQSKSARLYDLTQELKQKIAKRETGEAVCFMLGPQDADFLLEALEALNASFEEMLLRMAHERRSKRV